MKFDGFLKVYEESTDEDAEENPRATTKKTSRCRR